MSEHGSAVGTSRDSSEWCALGLLILLAVLAPLVRTDWMVGGFRIGDAVTLVVPLALLGSLPYLHRLGVDGAPPFAIEIPACAFLLVAIPSVLVAQDQTRALLTWLRYASYMALVWTAASVFIREGNRRLFLWASLITAGVTALRAFAQVAWPTSYDREFQIGDGVVRAFAWMVNPNFYSEYLVLMIAIAIAVVVSERRWLRIAAIGIGVLLALALAFTYTRGSWIGLAAGLVVMAFLVDRRLLIALAGFACLLLLVPGVAGRALSTFIFEGSSVDRLNLWQMAVDIIRNHPVIGVGVGGYLDAFRTAAASDPSFLVGDLRMTPHNSILLTTAETGIAGGIVFSWLLARAARLGPMFARRFGPDRRSALVNASLTVGIVAFVCNSMVSNSFQHPQAVVFFWLLVALLSANAGRAWTRDAEPTAWYSWLPRTRGRSIHSLLGGRMAASLDVSAQTQTLGRKDTD